MERSNFIFRRNRPSGLLKVTGLKTCFYSFILLLLMTGSTHAALTKQLSYQGRLQNASGQPVPNGTYSVTFSIYNVATGGAPLFTETQNVVVDGGGFSAYLGSVTPLNLLFNEDYFLGLTVGADPEMTPRLKLAIVGTSAFALDAGNAANFGGQPPSNFAPSVHNHDSNYSPLSHTHAPTGVTQIVAGANVTISPSGGIGVVTINAIGGGGGTPLTPSATVTAVSPSPVVGISTNYAREDHAHGIAPATLTGAMIAGSTITDLNIASTAGIATSKLSGTVSAIPGNGLGALATMNAVGSPQIVDGSIAFADIAFNGCTTGQIMKYNGTAWACDVDVSGGAGAIVNNPGATQTIIAGAPTTIPLVLKGAAGTTVPMFEVQDSTGIQKLAVMSDGHVFIPGTNQLHVLNINNDSPTGPMGNITIDVIDNIANSKLSILNSNPSFKAQLDIEGRVLVGNPTIQAAGISVLESSATDYAARLEIGNASNTVPLILGNHGGTGNLLQLQKSAVDKFVVSNMGNITTVNGGANAVPLTSGATQQLILKGNTCEGTAPAQSITLSFTPAFVIAPTITASETTAGAGYVANITGATTAAATINLGGANTATIECVNWIAIGDK